MASVAEPTITAYANTDIPKLSSASDIQVMDKEVILNSFTLTIDHPAVFVGATTTGYAVVGRGAECAVTGDAQVKYDANTKTMINEFDTQTGSNSSTSAFQITNDANFGILTKKAVYTNVALSEGDAMMLDVSVKAVDNGSLELVVVDIT